MTTSAPTYGTGFAPYDTDPLQLRKGQDDLVALDGLAESTAEISACGPAPWFTLPSGYRPAVRRFGTCYVQGGQVLAFTVHPDGAVTGVARLIGDGVVPPSRFWSFASTFKAA